ncbi:SMC-Scp complex subunit ScpB [Sessilibacter sp. MAH4]
MEELQLKKIIEGALLAAGQPLDEKRLLSLFESAEAEDVDSADVTIEDIKKVIDLITLECEGRGFELKQVGSGWRFQVREETAPWVNRLWEEKPQKYSRALLETLALIAYRQPITRGDIEEIRGVAVSSHIIKTLTEREWVKVVGHRDVPGRPSLYATTRAFLDYFNLSSLEELPSLGELADIDQLNPELDLNAELQNIDNDDADQSDDSTSDANAVPEVDVDGEQKDSDAELESDSDVQAPSQDLDSEINDVAAAEIEFAGDFADDSLEERESDYSDEVIDDTTAVAEEDLEQLDDSDTSIGAENLREEDENSEDVEVESDDSQLDELPDESESVLDEYFAEPNTDFAEPGPDLAEPDPEDKCFDDEPTDLESDENNLSGYAVNRASSSLFGDDSDTVVEVDQDSADTVISTEQDNDELVAESAEDADDAQLEDSETNSAGDTVTQDSDESSGELESAPEKPPVKSLFDAS